MVQMDQTSEPLRQISHLGGFRPRNVTSSLPVAFAISMVKVLFGTVLELRPLQQQHLHYH